METDFLASGNHFVLLEAVFPYRGTIFSPNPLLQPVATDFLFNGTIFFHSYFF